ncbi:Hpt domain-containing protein [Algibacillus agarilyticus]|uniref:Hpt domain-containing protein n=1 Tax=Algibacillus agarilyticus TaxID=2234133 RepID=UPI000DD06AEB|nr:Hpt domain-containing protein [Algibacillus agarilyticus]
MPNDCAIYDPAILSSLIGNEEDLINEYKQEFIKQSITSLKTIALNYNKHDYHAMKEDAHYLKTSAKALGALQCAQRLQAIENAALKEDKNLLKQLVMELKTDVQNIKKVFKP